MDAIKDEDRERQFNDKVSQIKVLLNYSKNLYKVHREFKVEFNNFILAECY